jgi:uncharacterized protein YgiM (DUF1202 family)
LQKCADRKKLQKLQKRLQKRADSEISDIAEKTLQKNVNDAEAIYP